MTDSSEILREKKMSRESKKDRLFWDTIKECLESKDIDKLIAVTQKKMWDRVFEEMKKRGFDNVTDVHVDMSLKRKLISSRKKNHENVT